MSRNKNNSDIESNILFEGVNPEIFQSFANPKNTVGKKEGAVIYQKGDLTEYLYILIEGTIKLKMREPDGTNIYVNKSENSFFGETELLGKTQRKSSAVADTDCRMYTLNISELKTLVKKDKQILKNIYNNKTFNIPEEEFAELTKDYLDPDTDFADIIRTTTESSAKKQTKSDGPPQVDIKNSANEEKEEQENEQGKFDQIITKDEIDETEEQTESLIIENNVSEQKEITEKEEEGVFDNIITKDEESEEDIIQEETPAATDKPEEISEDDQLEESEGFVIQDISADNYKKAEEEIEEETGKNNLAESENSIIEDSSSDIDNIKEDIIEEPEENNLTDTEGFVIEEPPAEENIKPGNTLNTFVLEEPVEEPFNQIEEENTSDVQPQETDADFSDYYETLLKTTQNIFSKITIDESAEAIADAATKLVNATGGVLYLVDKEHEELKAKVLSDNSIKDIRIKFSDGVQGTAVMEKRSIILENPDDNKNFNPAIEDLTGIKFKNVIYYPVLTKNEEAIAVLEIYNSERGKFDSREIELLNAVSSSIQKALSNARYVDILVHQRKLLSLGEITGFIKNDIKNSLLKVKYYSSLLKKKDLSPEAIKLIDLQIGQINSVEDFLRFTDAYANGKNIVEQSTIKVSEAVTQILNFLAEYVDSRNTIIYKKIENDAVVNIDLPAMYIACYQIAKNACDAMNDNGKIFVTSEKDGNYIKIKFRDEGVGISETIKGKLFKPFVSYGKKQRPGLGLAIAEKLVTDQGGYMLAESVLGEGSTFSIALPIVF